MTQPQWDEVRVARWLGKIDALEAELQPVSDPLFEAAALAPGTAVLDVGCGAGSTMRRAADAVAPTNVGAPSLGNRSWTKAMLEAAGWRNVGFDRRSDRLHLGGPAPLEQALDAVMDFGPCDSCSKVTPPPSWPSPGTRCGRSSLRTTTARTSRRPAVS